MTMGMRKFLLILLEYIDLMIASITTFMLSLCSSQGRYEV